MNKDRWFRKQTSSRNKEQKKKTSLALNNLAYFLKSIWTYIIIGFVIYIYMLHVGAQLYILFPRKVKNRRLESLKCGSGTCKVMGFINYIVNRYSCTFLFYQVHNICFNYDCSQLLPYVLLSFNLLFLSRLQYSKENPFLNYYATNLTYELYNILANFLVTCVSYTNFITSKIRLIGKNPKNIFLKYNRTVLFDESYYNKNLIILIIQGF